MWRRNSGASSWSKCISSPWAQLLRQWGRGANRFSSLPKNWQWKELRFAVPLGLTRASQTGTDTTEN